MKSAFLFPFLCSVVVSPTIRAADASGSPVALYRAVSAEDWETAGRELAAKADPNTLYKDGLTLLYYAVVAGKREQVAWLLKAGAKPDVDRQALTPLLAAATSGDVELTKMLLQAGAVVPTDPIDPGTLAVAYKPKSPALLHPAVAAMRSGSVPVLELLLEQQPSLELDALFEADWIADKTKYSSNGTVARPHAVADAIRNRHQEMAAFLILHGCRIDAIESRFLNREQTFGPRSMLISAILTRPAMLEVVDALEQRGCPMIHPNVPTVNYMIIAWDGLSAAVAAGDTALADRIMTSCTQAVSRDYQNRLLLLAEASGEPSAVKLVKQRCPNLKLPEWKPGTRMPDYEYRPEPDSNNDAVRELLPRKRPPAKQPSLKGDRVLAVIAAPDADGQGAALAAEASQQPGWKVVEREDVETLLRESDYANPWAKGRHDFSAMGDRLSADVLVFVSQLKSADLTVLRFEAVDVLSGLAIERRHVDAKEFKPAQFANDYLAAVRAKLQERLEGRSLTAVTLLGLTADDKVPSRRSLEAGLRTGLLGAIDATPGMISLTRDQMLPIVAEKTFQKPAALWNAAWTIEGGIAPLENERIELGLRLRSLGGTATSHDAKAAGTQDELPRMIREAWRDLLKAAGNTAVPKERDPAALAAEAARLLREAEWFMNMGHCNEAMPMAEAARFLGADPLHAISIQLHARFETRTYLRNRYFSGDWGIPPDPRQPDVMQMVASHLDENLDFLRLTAELYNRHHDAIIQWTDVKNVSTTEQEKDEDIFWRLLEYFVGLRVVLQPQRMDAGQLAMLEQYDRELDGFVRRMIDPSQNDRRLRYYFSSHLNFEDYEASQFAAVPALPERLVETLIRLPETCRNVNRLFNSRLGIDRQESPWEISDPGYHLTKEEILCRQLEKFMQGRDVPRAAIRRAEIAFMRSSGAGRVLAARRLQQAHEAEMAAGQTSMLDYVLLAPLDRYLPTLDKTKQGLVDEKPSSELPPPVPQPTPVPQPAPVPQPPVVKREVAALEVTRIVDVRGNMADKAAVLSNPFVDPLDRKLLWFLLQSVPDWNIPPGWVLDVRGTPPSYYPVNRPWLLAVDCSDGQYRQRIDLAASPGLWPQGSPKSLQWGSIDYGEGWHWVEIIASDSAFLVHVLWGNMSRISPSLEWRLNANTVVRIDRRSGKVMEIPGLPLGFEQGSGARPPLGTSIGDSFFVSARGLKQMNENNWDYLLWHVKPDGTLKQLTKTGRRLEQSPLDVCVVANLARIDKGWLVAADQGWGHIGYYNPKNEVWEPVADENEALKRAMEFEHAKIELLKCPKYILKMNDGTEDVAIDAQNPRVGRLVVVRNNKEPRKLPVITKVPDSYTATYNNIPIKDMIASGQFVTVILNQTEEHLMLGLCLKDTARYERENPLHRCLPFLWMLEKNQLREAIRKMESDGP